MAPLLAPSYRTRGRVCLTGVHASVPERMSMIRFEAPVTHPGEEPPPQVRSELLWRLAVRLFREHQPDPCPATDPRTCATCHRPWPCSGQRMAQLGLNEANR